MNKKVIFLTLACLPLLSGAVVSNDQAIEKRQAAFKQIKGAVADVKDAMRAKDYPAAETYAGIVLTNAQAVTELFPQGSYEGDTRAKPKIWDDLSDFRQRQQTLVGNAEQLVAASQAGDARLLSSAFKTLSKDCKGCHRKYRQAF